MGLQGTQADDKDKLQAGKVFGDDGEIQAIAHLHQSRSYPQLLGEVNKLYP